MKSSYFLALALLLLVITPVPAAADMYCSMNTVIGGGRR